MTTITLAAAAALADEQARAAAMNVAQGDTPADDLASLRAEIAWRESEPQRQEAAELFSQLLGPDVPAAPAEHWHIRPDSTTVARYETDDADADRLEFAVYPFVTSSGARQLTLGVRRAADVGTTFRPVSSLAQLGAALARMSTSNTDLKESR